MESCLERLGQSYEGCEEEISDLVYQINKLLEEKRSEWENSYNNLLESHNNITKSVAEYKLCIADRDVEITDLRKELSVIDKSNYERRLVLESKISELSQTVTSLKSKCSSPIPPRSPNSLELTISALKKESDYYKDKIAELEVVQSTHNTQIQLLEEQRTGLLRKNEDQRQKFSRCRRDYQCKVETITGELDRLGQLKTQHETTISTLKEKNESKDGEVRAAKEALEDVLSSNHRNNSAFSNMKSSLSQLQSEKDSLTSQISALTAENSRLRQEKDSYECKITYSERSVENVTSTAQKEISLLQGQVEVYQRENEFLRSMLMAREQTPVLERLEADNNSLKDNIQSMEREIANLIRVSKEGAGGEVMAVKERYERHLYNMKAEVEQLRLENLSLKVAHGGGGSFAGGSTFSSMIFGTERMDVTVEEQNVEKEEENEDTIIIDQPRQAPLTPIKSSMAPSVLSTPPRSPALSSFDSPRSVRSAPCKSTSSPLTRTPIITSSPQTRTPNNPTIIREFEEIQSQSLRLFEEKLNECVASFSEQFARES